MIVLVTYDNVGLEIWLQVHVSNFHLLVGYENINYSQIIPCSLKITNTVNLSISFHNIPQNYVPENRFCHIKQFFLYWPEGTFVQHKHINREFELPVQINMPYKWWKA